MRNQQIKKVNRVFFSGQDEDKRKWIEQMAAEGWLLISASAFVYSFQKIATENDAIQPSYRSILGLDLQKSMPIFQESLPEWSTMRLESSLERNTKALAVLPKANRAKSADAEKVRHTLFITLALLTFLVMSFTKIALISRGDFVALFRWQFLAAFLLTLLGVALGTALLLKSLWKMLTIECKTKK